MHVIFDRSYMTVRNVCCVLLLPARHVKVDGCCLTFHLSTHGLQLFFFFNKRPGYEVIPLSKQAVNN